MSLRLLLKKLIFLTLLSTSAISLAQTEPIKCFQLFSSKQKTLTYPQFKKGDYDNPEFFAYEYFQKINSNNPSKEQRYKVVTTAAKYNFQLLRADPNLKSLSDLELKKASLRALSWYAYVSHWVGMSAPSIDPYTGFALEKYRLYLKATGVDPNLKPASFENMLKQFGYNTLAHGTSITGLLDIIANGKLVSQHSGGLKAQYIGSPDYIYLEALPKVLETYFFNRYPVKDINWWSENHKMPVYIEFKTSVLDDLAWDHFNIYWMFGKKSNKYSINPSNLLAAFFNMVKEVPATDPRQTDAGYKTISEINARNEFLFTEAIDFTKYVKAIHVDPSFKESIIAQLKATKVDQKILDLID